MILQAEYDSFDLIPEAHRALYQQLASGKWQFKHAEVQGLAEITNPGLAANRDSLKNEKLAAERARDTAVTAQRAAEAQLEAGRQPGSVTLSQADAETWKKYRELGDVQGLEKIKTEHAELTVKTEQLENSTRWREAAEKGNLNYDVLNDLLTSERGKGLDVKTVEMEVEDPKNPKGAKIKQNVAVFVIKEAQADGKTFKETETPVLAYAKDKFPEYIHSALAATEEGAAGAAGQQASGAGKTHLPVGGGQSATKTPATTEAAAKRAEKFNADRSTRPSPFGTPPAAAAPAAGTGINGAA